MKRVFITGTGTAVGKTFVSCLLIDFLREKGQSVAAFKPICCGSREDAATLHASAASSLPIDSVNPIWLKMPAAPLMAARIEGREIDLQQLDDALLDVCSGSDWLVIEGVGGWEVPLVDKLTMADLAQRWDMPVVIVADNVLGALNHILLTAKNIEARGLELVGVILNSTEDERDAASIGNRQILEEDYKLPIIGEVLHGAESFVPEGVFFC